MFAEIFTLLGLWGLAKVIAGVVGIVGGAVAVKKGVDSISGN